jgi:hypothetical protein
VLARARASLGDQDFDVAWAAGHAVSFEDILAEALDAADDAIDRS